MMIQPHNLSARNASRFGWTTLLLVLSCGALRAQQEPQITQFMFHKMALNAGFAGSFESPTLSTNYRKQWLGLDGAPDVQILSYTQPLLNNRVGIGGNLMRSSLGISRNITLDLAYAYRIPLRRGVLGIGLQASVRHLFQNWADPRLIATQAIEIDPAIPMEPRSKLLPNFGFGLYYTGINWYVGVAAPRMVSNNIDFAELGSELSREAQHINAMGGLDLVLDNDLTLMPQLFVRYVQGAPLSVNPHLSALLYEKLYLGATFSMAASREGLGESLQALVGLQATSELFFCLSYDIGLTSLRRHHNGSVEASARWYFNPPEGKEIINPRDFSTSVKPERRARKKRKTED